MSSSDKLDINILITQTARKLREETSKIKTEDKAAIKDIERALNLLDTLGKSANTNSDFEKIISKLKTIRKIVNSLESGKTSKELLQLYSSKEEKESSRTEKTIALNKERDKITARKQQLAQDFESANLRYATGPNASKKVGFKTLIKNPEKVYSNLSADDAKTAQEIVEKNKNLQVDEEKASQAINTLTKEIEDLTTEISTLKQKIKDEKAKNPTEVSPINSFVHETTSDTISAIEDKMATDSTNKAKQVDLSLNNLNIEKIKDTGFKRAFKQFSIYALALKSVKKAVREAVSTIKELDSSLTEQAMVTGKTRKQTYELLSTYQDLAKQTGATTKEISELATQFIRQGKTTKEALVLTTAAMDAAKVAGISSSDSINYLTTALNGFQLSANDAMKVSDKFAAVSANAATSYDEIATALSKVASQANLAGMSIDYTTALLAKGLETTREAPETMGTALKTIIARMREISDYGETLSGDTDINNVESQLAYVGIALRDANGELRSTEEVLDELGRKWDTLNSNQQAAVAKALAGTRQQSRLIAMMTDYERVVELQQISERSSGATLSQMSTYLEGMNAALNKVNVSYEKLITALTNSDVIIGVVNAVGEVLNTFASFADNTAVTVILWTALGTLALTALGNKLREYAIAKQLTKENKLQEKLKLQEQINTLKGLKTKQKQLSVEKSTTKELSKQAILESEGNDLQKEKLANEELNGSAEFNKEDEAYLISLEEQLKLLEAQESTVGGIINGFTGLSYILGGIFTLGKKISSIFTIIGAIRKKNNKEDIKDQKKVNVEKGKGAFAKLVEEAGVAGIVTGIALLAALGLGIGIPIALNKKSVSSTSKSINELSNKIYKLNEKSQNLKTVIDSYHDIDNAIIKTKEDQEELNTLLEQAADKLSDEEQAIYSGLSNTRKIKYLEEIRTKTINEANTYRQQQLSKVNKLSTSQKAKFFVESTDNSDILNAQQAFYAISNQNLYDFMDKELAKTNEFTAEELTAIEKLTQGMLDGVKPAKAYWYAQNPDKIGDIATAVSKLSISYNGLNTSVASILTSDDYDAYTKVVAYREAITKLDDANKDLLKTLYSDIDALAQFSDTTLQLMVDLGISNKDINNMGKAFNELGYNTQEATDKMEEFFDLLQSNTNISDAIQTTFRDILAPYDKDSDEWKNIYNKILNAYSDAVSTGVLNMGQNIESLKKTINGFYEKASKWSTLSDTEKTEFLTDNAELFAGNNGLYEALQSGDYNTMYDALLKQQSLSNKVAEQIKKINTELEIERNKLEPQKEYISYLEEQLALLQDTNNLYRASLELRLKEEQNYLNEYKNYLSDQQKALQDSLNDRKDAYQKYFDAINQQSEDEDFEEKESTLIANIAKLATSTSADSMNKRTQLEEELKNLEEERIQTLRDRAQEAIMENIDDELQQINNKFDDLLNSQQALLAAMTGELDSPENFLANLITNKVDKEGLTALGLEDYIGDLQTTYGSLLGTEVFKDMTVREVGNQLILNIAGKEINLTDNEQQSVYEAIITALKQVGLR